METAETLASAGVSIWLLLTWAGKVVSVLLLSATPLWPPEADSVIAVSTTTLSFSRLMSFETIVCCNLVPSASVNRSQPSASTRLPSPLVPEKVHSDTARSPWTKWL